MSRSARLLCVAVAFLLTPAGASAIATGDLKVESALNEPLRAEIALNSVSPQDLKTLTATLVASPDIGGTNYDSAPISRDLRVTLARTPDGQPLLKVFSDLPVREPFVHFFLQLDWAGGRLVHEFTALIDLPRSEENVAANAAPETGAVPPQPESGVQAIAKPPIPVVSEAAPTHAESTVIEAAPDHPAGAAKNTAIPPSSAVPKAPAVPTRRAASKSAKPASTPPVPEATTSPAKPGAAEATAPGKQAQAPQSEESPMPEPKLEKQRLESDIKEWAHTQTQTPSQSSVATESRAPEDRTAPSPGAAPAKQPTAGPQQLAPAAQPVPIQHHKVVNQPAAPVQQSGGGWLVIVVALLSVLVVALGAFVIFAYTRQRLMLKEHDELRPEAERRRGEGRRREFLPVAIERRRGPRRDADQVQPAVSSVYSDEEAHLAEPLTSDATPDKQLEKMLHQAIALNPDHHALRVKLLALYYQRGDKNAFESLVNQLYAALERAAPASTRPEPIIPERRLFLGEMTPESVDSKRDNGIGSEQESRIEQPFVVADASSKQQAQHAGAGVADAKSVPPESSSDPANMEDDSGVPRTDVPLTTDEAASLGFKEAAADRQPDASEIQSEDLAVSTRGIEVLHVDDFTDIREAVERGMTAINGDDTQQPAGLSASSSASGGSGRARTAKGKRKRKGPGRRAADAANARRRQWQDPAIKIDLAKAYIDMGEAERARAILDEVLKRWHEDDAAGS